MNLLLSTIGKRGYIADYFRQHMSAEDRLIGTGNSPWTPGFHRCDDVVLMPDIESEEYLGAVLQICEQREIGALVSFSDPDVFRLSSIREELIALGVTPFIPGPQPASICFDKYETARFLDELGIGHPRTAVTLKDAADFTFPLFLKPRTGSGSASNYRVDNSAELERVFDSEPNMLIQEFVRGEEINVEVLGDLEGQIVGLSNWRKYQSTRGETEQSVTIRDEGVIDVALQAARALGVVGPMDIDLMRTADGVIVIEFNPRFGGGYPVSQLAGADFPGKMMAMARGETVKPDLDYTVGVAMMKELTIIGGSAETFLAHGRQS